MQINHVELQTKPIDPNRAKYYALGLAAVAGLFALVTIKSNYDYFETYYTGWSFWLRVIPFFAFEATIIGLTLTKGWGNPKQMGAALVFEAALVLVGLTHTYYVSSATQLRHAAAASKAAARQDVGETSRLAREAADTNERLRREYTASLAAWRRAAYVAQANRMSPPVPPAEPQYVEIPKVSQEAVAAASLDVEGRIEGEVPHRLLLRILFVMIGLVIGAWTAVVFLADGSRLRYWLLQQRGARLDEEMKPAKPVVPLGQQAAPAPVSAPLPFSAEKRRGLD